MHQANLAFQVICEPYDHRPTAITGTEVTTSVLSPSTRVAPYDYGV